MKMKKKLLTCLATGLFLITIGPIGAASAALISQDLYTSGDGLLTYDSVTGLSWLDVPLTLNHSYNEVISGFGGFTGQGFRYATATEFSTLLKDSNIQETYPYNASTDPQGFQAVSKLMQLLGINWKNFNSRGTYGLYEDPSFNPQVPSHQWARLYTNDYGQWTASRNWAVLADADSFSQVGSFLVRSSSPAPVPEPSTILLFGTSIICLAGYRIKRQKK